MSTIQSFWTANTQLSSNDRGTLGIDTATTYPLPGAVTVDEFHSWTLTRQNAYLDARGTGTPKSVTIGPVGGEQLTAKRSAKLAVEFQVADRAGNASTVNYYAQNPNDPVGLVAESVDYNTTPSSLDARTFMSWRKEDQVAYLTKNSVSAGGTLTIGSDSSGFKNAVKATLTTDIEIIGGLVFDTGSAADIPYLHLPGSAQGAVSLSGLGSPFGQLDGKTTKLSLEDRPDNFGINPSTLSDSSTPNTKDFIAAFATWHSAYQLEYVKTWGTAQTGTTGSPAVLKIPTTGTVQLEAFVSRTDQTKLYFVNALDKSTIAKMSKVDQDNLTGMSTFSTIKARAGVAGINEAAVTSVTDNSFKTANAAITQLRNYITNKSPAQQISELMSETDRKYFTRQLDVMEKQLLTMGLVSPADIGNTLSEIKKRFDRAFAFWDVRVPESSNVRENGNSGSTAPVYSGAIGLDFDSSGNVATSTQDLAVRKGYAIFIAQEKRKCELMEQRQSLAQSGSLGGTTLDAPTLVYRFQSLYNSEKEASVIAETEEINQQNILLKTYAAIQDAVNEVLSRFEKADGDSKEYLFKNDNVQGYYSMTAKERLTLAIFEDVLGGQPHPIEKLNKIDRPKQNLVNNSTTGVLVYDLEQYTHNQWSQFASRLSEAVTQINQNSQLKMNSVNTLDKERNRHFELANGALSKLADTLQNIARSG